MAKVYLFMFGKDGKVLSMDENLFSDFPDLNKLKSASDLMEIITPEDQPRFQENWNRVVNRSLTHFDFEGFVFGTKTQKLGCMFIQPYPGENEQIQGILNVSEFPSNDNPREIISSLFEHNPLPFYCFDLDGKFIQLNQKLIDFTGVSEETILTLRYSDFIHPDDLHQTDIYFEQALKGISNQYELRVVLASGEIRRIRVNKFPRILAGKVTGVYGVFEDITERYESEKRWRDLVEQSPLPVLVFVDRKFVFTNSAAAKFYAVDDPKDLIGRDLLEFVPPEEKEILLAREQRLLDNEKLEPRETTLLSTDGSSKDLIVHARTIMFEGKKGIQSILFDISDLKKQKNLVERSLKEKETLLKEIHHRVKNNLAIISGLIELQIQNIKDQATIDVLRDCQNRIQSIALVHQKLYQFESLDSINLGTYIHELAESIKTNFTGPNNVEIDIVSEEIVLTIEQAIPCSLIINEVIVNAFKHAFEGILNPTIKIELHKSDNSIAVRVSDNGIGMKEIKTNPENGVSLGTTLISILSQQLEGVSSYVDLKKPGVHFLLTFPFD